MSTHTEPKEDGTLQMIGRHFDETTDAWVALYGEQKERWSQYHTQRLRERYALALMSNEPKGLAVDLGCGTGHALLGIKRIGFERVIGVDISENMLAAARELVFEAGLSECIEVLKGDVQNLKTIESGSVDVCSALGVIEYQNEDGPMLAEISRILTPNGAAIVQMRNYYCIRSRTCRRLPAAMVGRLNIDFRYHRPSEFRDTLSQFGLTAERELYSHYYALYPLDLIPFVRRVIRPIDNYLSKACERWSSRPFSMYLASSYMVKLRKSRSVPT